MPSKSTRTPLWDLLNLGIPLEWSEGTLLGLTFFESPRETIISLKNNIKMGGGPSKPRPMFPSSQALRGLESFSPAPKPPARAATTAEGFAHDLLMQEQQRPGTTGTTPAFPAKLGAKQNTCLFCACFEQIVSPGSTHVSCPQLSDHILCLCHVLTQDGIQHVFWHTT